jgi:hypothetical protein
MTDPLIGVHAFLGEMAVFAFFWIFVELFNPGKKTVSRMKLLSGIGMALLLLSWVAGGYYYVTVYGSEVKPLIKAGPQAWAHSVFMETKEHVFLFLPFLGLMVFLLIHSAGDALLRDRRLRQSIQLLSLLIVLMGLAMAGMGYLISTGARNALEAGVKI